MPFRRIEKEYLKFKDFIIDIEVKDGVYVKAGLHGDDSREHYLDNCLCLTILKSELWMSIP